MTARKPDDLSFIQSLILDLGNEVRDNHALVNEKIDKRMDSLSFEVKAVAKTMDEKFENIEKVQKLHAEEIIKAEQKFNFIFKVSAFLFTALSGAAAWIMSLLSPTLSK